MEIKISGLREVQEKLAGLPSLIVAQAMYKALDRAAGVIAAEVEQRTERLDESGSDTRLADCVIVDVEVDPMKHGGQASVGFSSVQDDRTGKPMDLIALWVEMGHMLVDHTGEVIGRVAPRPFMRQAFDAAADRAIEVFAESLLEGLGND